MVTLPICSPPGQFEDSEEDSEGNDPYEGLCNEAAELKMKSNLLEERTTRRGRTKVDGNGRLKDSFGD
jgi:hypothetical protein